MSNCQEKLAEFVTAQDEVYAQVRRELLVGKKQGHWMGFIFPQVAGLGTSPMAVKYGIASVAEAREYLNHEVLGTRLRKCTRLLLGQPTRNITAILGSPDDIKFRSSMTLFALASPDELEFVAALEKFFGGKRDPLTIELLRKAAEPTD